MGWFCCLMGLAHLALFLCALNSVLTGFYHQKIKNSLRPRMDVPSSRDAYHLFPESI